jgi:ribonuclease VapC
VAERYLLDTSALLAFTDAEEGANEVERLLQKARAGRCHLLICSITLMELFYTTLREQGEDGAARLVAFIKSWPVSWVYPDEKVLLQAGKLKATYHLSVADALIAAVAKLHRAVLVHKDPELQALRAEVRLFSLPFKVTR